MLSIFKHIQHYAKKVQILHVCLHKGESCACLSSIVEPLLGLLKEDNSCIIKHTEPKAADPFQIKVNMTFIVSLLWEKDHFHRIYRHSKIMLSLIQ